MKYRYFLLLFIFFSACSPKEKTTEEASTSATIVIGEPDQPAPSSHPKPRVNPRVVVSDVVYSRINGNLVQGYMATPLNSRNQWLPALVVIHEWWGLNEHVKIMAEKFAEQGYRVLAVDLYNGKTTTNSDEAMTYMKAVTGELPKTLDNVKNAVQYLETQVKTTKIGVMGWRMGGMLSLQLALAMPQDVKAAAIYYGSVQATRARLARLQTPILGFFGAKDTGLPIADVRTFEANMKALNKSLSLHIYPEAGNAFANPNDPNYRETDALDASAKTLAFFNQYLKN